MENSPTEDQFGITLPTPSEKAKGFIREFEVQNQAYFGKQGYRTSQQFSQTLR